MSIDVCLVNCIPFHTTPNIIVMTVSLNNIFGQRIVTLKNNRIFMEKIRKVCITGIPDLTYL